MKVTVDPSSGKILLLPRPQTGGGGSAGGGGRQSFANIGTSDPATGADGDLFYNTAEGTLKIWITSEWVSIGGSVVDGAFDFMDGNDLAFMNGDSIDFMSG